MDAFGNIEVKPVEDDFYLGSQKEAYEVLNESGTYLATIEDQESGPTITELSESYFSRALSEFERPEKYIQLEDMETSIASEIESDEQIKLEYAADLKLVEAVEEAVL